MNLIYLCLGVVKNNLGKLFFKGISLSNPFFYAFKNNMKKYNNQFEFNRDYKVVSEISGKLVGQLINYPRVTAKGFNHQDLEVNLEDELTDYLMNNDCVDFETGEPKVYK